jgi:hypothetical protein
VVYAEQCFLCSTGPFLKQKTKINRALSKTKNKKLTGPFLKQKTKINRARSKTKNKN